MKTANCGAILFSTLWPAADHVGAGQGDNTGEHAAAQVAADRKAMERTDWLDQAYDSAEARFLMLTAITHHRFDSPVWGQDEVRKLHLELTEIDMLTTQAAVEHAAARARRRLASGTRRLVGEVS